MRAVSAVFLVLCIWIGESFGHLCLISPPQRGSMMGLNKPASPDCILMPAPCGGRGRNPEPALLIRNRSNFTVTFQKNLDHWTQASPGYFSVSVSMGRPDEGSFKELARIPDKGEPSLHLYSVNVTMVETDMASMNRVLQVQYMTKNPAAPPVFYQCSDFLLVP